MKILFLTTHLRFGGITTYVTSLARRLVELGHQVVVGSAGGDMVSEIEKVGIEHIKINIDTSSELNPILFAAGAYLRRVMAKQQIDIIHAQTRVTQVLAYLICCAIPVKKKPILVTTCHGFFRPHLMRRILPCWGNKVIAISEAVREHLVNDLHVPKTKITTIPNGVDTDRFIYPITEQQKYEYKKKIDIEPNHPVVGIIARLSPVKGHRYLIRAFKYIVDKVPQAYLIVVGEGPDKKTLISLVEELNIEDKVKFMPATKDTAPLLAAMDIFVMPSLQEGLGLSIMEAMAAGLPVVASDVGGIYTVVEEDQTGFLVSARNVDGLSRTIIKLINEEQLRRRMGHQAREFIETNFSLDTMARRVEELYSNLLAIRHTSS